MKIMNRIAMAFGFLMVVAPVLAHDDTAPIVIAAKNANYDAIVKALKDPHVDADDVRDAQVIVFNKKQPLAKKKTSKTSQDKAKIKNYDDILTKLNDWLAAHK